MVKNRVLEFETEAVNSSRSALDEVLREGAQRMLQVAIESEVASYIEGHKNVVDVESGHRLVVRNGRMPERRIQTTIGDINIQQPRVLDRREDKSFTSSILPRYARKSPCLESLLPTLYLKGISSSSFPRALQSILGEQAKGLSSNTIQRLKAGWEKEYLEWTQRDLSGKEYVYIWADGIYFNVRLADDRPCLLVIIGTLPDGTKELVSIYDGERESKMSWAEMMRDMKMRGLQKAPRLAVGDGGLGFWAALEEEFPNTREQRCWVHKTANILDKMPKRTQAPAKDLIHQMYMSETKEHALLAYKEFIHRYQAKFPKAVECLRKDKDVLFAFYDFPAEHWIHIRTTNPIESTFATVRHRQRLTKGNGSRKATLSMAFKLAREAEMNWRRIQGYKLIPRVIEGVKFVDGIEVDAA